MFCPKCGMKNNDENLWCIKCGTKLEFVLAVDAQPVEERPFEEKLDDAQPQESVFVETEPLNAEEVKKYSQRTPNEPKRIKDHFVWAILAAVFGSIIFGVIAVIFSGLTQSEQATKNFKKAEMYSSKAKLFCVIATVIGGIKILFVGILLILAFTMAFLPFYLG